MPKFLCRKTSGRPHKKPFEVEENCRKSSEYIGSIDEIGLLRIEERILQAPTSKYREIDMGGALHPSLLYVRLAQGKLLPKSECPQLRNWLIHPLNFFTRKLFLIQ